MEAALRPVAGEVGFGDSCHGSSLPRMAGVGEIGPHGMGCALTEREGERAQGVSKAHLTQAYSRHEAASSWPGHVPVVSSCGFGFLT